MVTNDAFEAYCSRMSAEVHELLAGTGARPVLFIGSGMAKRYLGAPSWLELLEAISIQSEITPDIFKFLVQKANNDLSKAGSFLVDPVHEWAWTKGKHFFPERYFQTDVDKSVFLKHLAAAHISSFSGLPSGHPLDHEIELLKRTAPHAVITTNFDNLVSDLFPDFERVIGENVIPMSMSITGEIYQIHGSVADPASLVLTSSDYDRFMRKRRYISSKMMTYFAEYPVFIFGYGLGDSNVNAIISDLGEAMRDKGGLLSNVFYIEWVPNVFDLKRLKEEHVVPFEVGSTPLRVRTIVTTDFAWVLNCLANMASPVPVNTRMLRHLAARVVDLVRTDVPKNTVDVDYKRIEQLSENPNELALVLGIGNISNPNIAYPYLLTQVAQKLGYNTWHHAHKLLQAANEKLGLNIQSTDNEHHVAFKSGRNTITRKYSDQFVELLREIRDEMSAPEVDQTID